MEELNDFRRLLVVPVAKGESVFLNVFADVWALWILDDERRAETIRVLAPVVSWTKSVRSSGGLIVFSLTMVPVRARSINNERICEDVT